MKCAVIDSGIGGLSILSSLLQYYPQLDYVYVGDTAHAPYGTKSQEYIIERVKALFTYLQQEQVDIVVIACNTMEATAGAIFNEYKQYFPIISIVGPTVRYALSQKTSSILVLATQATVQSEIYRETIHKLNPEVQVSQQACPLFVEIVEGTYPWDAVRGVVRTYLQDHGHASTVILGCTHFPYLSKHIQEVLKGVTVYDSSQAILSEMKDFMEGIVCADMVGSLKLIFTKDTAQTIQWGMQKMLGKVYAYEVKEL